MDNKASHLSLCRCHRYNFKKIVETSLCRRRASFVQLTNSISYPLFAVCKQRSTQADVHNDYANNYILTGKLLNGKLADELYEGNLLKTLFFTHVFDKIFLVWLGPFNLKLTST